MLISFFNPSDLIGCGGDISQSDSFRYMEGVHGGVHRVCRGGTWRGTRRGYAEGYVEAVHRGGTWRGMWRGYMEGYAEGVHRGIHGGVRRGVHGGGCP